MKEFVVQLDELDTITDVWIRIHSQCQTGTENTLV